MTEPRFCACDCGASLAGLRADAVYASEACAKRAKRAANPDKARTTGPTDCEKVLTALRARGKAGIHSHEIRRLGFSGNPSQRVTELEEQGFEISHVREHKGRRPGIRYLLIAEPSSRAEAA
jgi:hypothetical protein